MAAKMANAWEVFIFACGMSVEELDISSLLFWNGIDRIFKIIEPRQLVPGFEYIFPDQALLQELCFWSQEVFLATLPDGESFLFQM
jgi:hypothetical protein